MITQKILKNLKKSKNFRLRRLWTKISPSSEGVGGKTGYLGLRSRSQLSRKQVFRMIGNVFRAENSTTQKSIISGKWWYVLFSDPLKREGIRIRAKRGEKFE